MRGMRERRFESHWSRELGAPSQQTRGGRETSGSSSSLEIKYPLRTNFFFSSFCLSYLFSFFLRSELASVARLRTSSMSRRFIVKRECVRSRHCGIKRQMQKKTAGHLLLLYGTCVREHAVVATKTKVPVYPEWRQCVSKLDEKFVPSYKNLFICLRYIHFFRYFVAPVL